MTCRDYAAHLCELRLRIIGLKQLIEFREPIVEYLQPAHTNASDFTSSTRREPEIAVTAGGVKHARHGGPECQWESRIPRRRTHRPWPPYEAAQ